MGQLKPQDKDDLGIRGKAYQGEEGGNKMEWPKSILKFKGVEGFNEEDRFENFRKGLRDVKRCKIGDEK